MLLSLVAVLATASPAFAVTACSEDDNSNQTHAQRVFLEFGGTTDGTYDGASFLDSDVDACSEVGGNDITFDAYPDVLVHVSCSADLSGADQISFPGLGPVTDFWVNSVNKGGNTPGSCQPLDSFPDPVDPVASLSTGECAFNEESTYPVTYSLTVNDGDGPFALFVDGVEDTTVTLTEGVDQPLGDFAPGTALEIRDGSTVLASTSVADATCAPDPDPPTPAITLVKNPVVGEGSDLVDLGPTPLLQFSDSETGSQTALYSYLITNTGDEPLVNISLADDRITAADLDFSDCTAAEPLGVGDSCTATGSEDFTLEQAQAVVDDTGTVTNTGTVTADGEESGDEVSDTDPATIAFELVFSEILEKPPAPGPAVGAVDSDEEEKAPVVLSAADELPATGLDDDGLLPLALLLIAMGAALLWLDRPWVGVR